LQFQGFEYQFEHLLAEIKGTARGINASCLCIAFMMPPWGIRVIEHNSGDALSQDAVLICQNDEKYRAQGTEGHFTSQ